MSLIDKLDELTLNLKDLLPEDEGDELVTDVDDYAGFGLDDEGFVSGHDATYCPECESVFEPGEDGYLGIACVDCGSGLIHEITWLT